MGIIFTLLFTGGGENLPPLLFSLYLRLKQSNFKDKGIYRTRRELPSCINEKIKICMHALEHACTQSLSGIYKTWFFSFPGLNIVLKPDNSPQDQPKFSATCVRFDTYLRSTGLALRILKTIFSSPTWKISSNRKVDFFS